MQDLMPPINTPDSTFHDGDPTTGQLGTIVTALWLNNVQSATRDVQLEIKNVLAKAGIQPDPKKTNQLAEAISQIIGSGNYASTAYVDNGLNKKIDKANISGQKGNDNDKVPSLNLFTNEVGKLQGKGNYANGELFYTSASYTGVRNATKTHAAILYNDGRYVVWSEELQRNIWGFDAQGNFNSGLIPLSCGGTGAKNASAARDNLSVYSQAETDNLLKGYQPKGNYAQAEYFYVSSSLTGATSPDKTHAAVMGNTGTFGVWSNDLNRYIWSVNGAGVLSGATLSTSQLTGVSQTSGDSDKAIMSQKAVTELVKNSAIGNNQKWQNVTAERVAQTNYTNTTSKAIFVYIVFSTSSNGSATAITVDNVPVGFLSSGAGMSNSFIVPAGSTYRVNVNATISQWSELR